MDITVRILDDKKLSVVALTGSLDVSGATTIDVEMKNTINKGFDIAVDLSGVTFISSQGTRILVITSKAATAKGQALYLIGPRAPVRKALTIMGVDKIIPIYNALEELGVNRGR